MYYSLIKSFVERLTVEDVKKFANKEGITLTEEEQNVIYEYVKQHWQTFYFGNPKPLLEELKSKLNTDTYNKIELLYLQAKERFN
jgi:sulfur relay (sulfurtransferase) DsrC/TusE family protein